MRMTSGKVIAGKVVLDPDFEQDPLEEGIRVTILVPEDGAIRLSPEEAADLREAIAQADSGDFIDGEEVLRGLRSQS